MSSPFEVLGISLAFVNQHPPDVVKEIAVAVSRALQRAYHPDAHVGEKPRELPSGITLDAIQAASKAVDGNLQKCIREIGQKARMSKEAKRVAELEAILAATSEDADALREMLQALWLHIANERLRVINKGEVVSVRNERTTYGIQTLNGLAIMVSPPGKKEGDDTFVEYLCDKGVWFTRTMTRMRWSANRPLPPGIPAELVTYSGGKVDSGSGQFYDQKSEHTLLEGFTVLGSYNKTALTNEQKRQAGGTFVKEGASAAPSLSGLAIPAKRTGIDTTTAAVLKPYGVIGNVLFSATKDNGTIQVKPLGHTVLIRSFDNRQRPSGLIG